MKKLQAFYKGVNTVYDSVTTVLYALIVIFLIVQVLGRYVLRVATPWTEEGARMLLIIVTLLASVIVSRKGEHLGAYFLRDKTRGRFKGVMFFLIALIEITILVLLMKGAYQIYSGMGDTRGVSIRWFHRQWLFIALLISCGFNALYALRDLINAFLVILGKKTITEVGLSSPFPGE